MNAYIYAADIYCEDCGRAIRDRLTPPATPDDEHTYDSGDFPKGPYGDAGGESDCPQNCADCGTYLAAPLTSAGVQYIIDYLAEALQRGRTTDCEATWADDLGDYFLDSNHQTILDAYHQRFGVTA